MSTVVNPLNFYGPTIPVSFEAMPTGGGVTKEEVQEQIDESMENVAYVMPEVIDVENNG